MDKFDKNIIIVLIILSIAAAGVYIHDTTKPKIIISINSIVYSEYCKSDGYSEYKQSISYSYPDGTKRIDDICIKSTTQYHQITDKSMKNWLIANGYPQISNLNLTQIRNMAPNAISRYCVDAGYTDTDYEKFGCSTTTEDWKYIDNVDVQTWYLNKLN